MIPGCGVFVVDSYQIDICKLTMPRFATRKNMPKLAIANHLRSILASPLPGTVERPSADKEMSCASQVTE